MWLVARRWRAPGRCACGSVISRCISSGAVRYDGDFDRGVTQQGTKNLSDQGLFDLVKNARSSGIPVEEALKSYDQTFSMQGLERLMVRVHPDSAFKVYSWAKSRAEFAYTRRFVIWILNSLRKSKNLDRAEAVVSDLSGRADVEVERLARSMLYAAYHQAKDSHKARKIRIELGHDLHPPALNHLVNLKFSEEGHEGAYSIYRKHLAKGIVLDADGIRNLFSKLCSGKKIDEALQVLIDSAERGVDHRGSSYCKLIDALVEKNRLQEALEIAEKFMAKSEHDVIKRRAVQNQIRKTLQGLIRRLGDAKFYSGAIKVLDFLVSKQQESPGDPHLMRRLIKDEHWSAAMQVVELMKRHGCKTNMHYTRLIRMLCEADRLEDAGDVIEAMRELGLNPNAKSYTYIRVTARDLRFNRTKVQTIH